MSCSFFSFINLLMLFVIMSENTFTQMESPLLRDQSGVPAERSHKTVTPVSRKQTVVQFSPLKSDLRPVLHGGKQPLEIGSLQQVLRLLFQVGGELVGWMTVRGILHCPLVL